MSTVVPSAAAAGCWQLGDQTVRRIGFGAMRLVADEGGRDGSPGVAAVTALLRRALDLGINHLDTAAFYPTIGGGEGQRWGHWANPAIRTALHPYPDDLLIATKVGPTPQGLARPEKLRALVEADLHALGRDALDLVYLRQAGLTSVDEHFGALADLRTAGLIRHLGLSNVRAEHLEQALRIAPVVAVQNRYALDAGRVNDALVEICAAQAIAFVPFFSLAGDGREGGGVAAATAVDEVATRHGASPAQVRLAWTLARGAHVLAIPGTSNAEHLIENVAAGGVQLTAGDIAALE